MPGARKDTLRILDAACGSGSFLLGAYQFLLDWHLAEYLKDPDRWLKGKRPPLERASGGITRLSIEERKRILMNNIYGVDIDPQAVEVTKLSLLLKVLEGEGVAAQMSFLPERVLPDLGRNIKCGNSLIGPEFYDGKLDLPDEEAVGRVNAFDWAREFPEAMAAGGFDAVIGNPPWGATFAEEELEYLRLRHRAIIIRMIDSYIYFVHAAFGLLNRHGTLGMILPSTVLTQADAAGLRKYLLANSELRVIVNLGQGVFGRQVLNTSAIVIADSGDQQPRPDSSLLVGDLRDASTDEKRLGLLNLTALPSPTWTDLVTSDSMSTFFTLRLSAVALAHRLRSRFAPLQDILEGEIQRGVSPDLAEAFVVDRKIAQEKRLEETVLRPLVLGKDIARYGQLASDHYLIYLNTER